MPEGSILGPVIFNIFIDFLLQFFPPDRTVAYVDDITLVSHDDSLASASVVQLLLQSVSNRANGHGMFISSEKCFVMYISPVLKEKTAQHQLSQYISTALIPIATSLRILGITFTPDLCWDAHCDIVCKKGHMYD